MYIPNKDGRNVIYLIQSLGGYGYGLWWLFVHTLCIWFINNLLQIYYNLYALNAHELHLLICAILHKHNFKSMWALHIAHHIEIVYYEERYLD